MNVLSNFSPFNDLKKTVKRFLGSVVCVLALFVIAIRYRYIRDYIRDDILFQVNAFLIFGFLWFGLTRLIIEGRAWSIGKELVLGSAGITILTLSIFSSDPAALGGLLFLIPALLLGISVGPYITSHDNLSFWIYNRQLWQNVVIAFFVALILWIGLSAALLAIDYLFSIDRRIREDILGYLLTFSAILFGPLYALSSVPKKFSYSETDYHAPTWLYFVLNWIFAPLVVIYILILYAYFIKIMIVGEMPRGQLAYMITAFGGLGIVIYLIGWPLRENGGTILRLVYRFFFPALIIPIIIQALSIYIRIEQYGMTEKRYLVVLSTVWFAFLAIAYIFRKPPLKWITGTLAVLLTVAAIGPLSALNVSVWNQIRQLKVVLKQNNILKQGKIRKAPNRISSADRNSISSILEFLRQRERLYLIRAWVPIALQQDVDFKNSPYNAQKTLEEAMGFDVGIPQRHKTEYVSMEGTNKDKRVIDVPGGFKVMVNPEYVYIEDNDKKTWVLKHDAHAGVFAYYQNGLFYVGKEGHGIIDFDVEAFALDELKRNPGGTKRHNMVVEETQNNLRIKLDFDEIKLSRLVKDDGNATPYRLYKFRVRFWLDY